MAYERVIFLCQDNGALSPMAESIFLSVYRGNPLYVASRGLVVLYEAPFNPKMETILANHDLKPVRELTMGLQKEDLTGVTLVVAMSERVLSQFRKSYPSVPCYTLAALANEEKDLKNPYGGNLMDYEECFNDISRMVRKCIPTLAELNRANDGTAHLTGLFEQEGSIIQ